MGARSTCRLGSTDCVRKSHLSDGILLPDAHGFVSCLGTVVGNPPSDEPKADVLVHIKESTP